MTNFIKNIISRKSQPLISVIVANYCNEKYIEECLDSILNQSYRNIELVVCDDCSTDASKSILNAYLMNHENIKVIYNKENIGISKTRHKAIVESSGDYITTLDSDDYYLSNDKLEKEMELVARYKKQKKKVIAFSNVHTVNANGEVISDYQGGRIKEGGLLSSIICRDCMIPRDFLFSKESYFQVGGFDPCINLFEDWDLKIRLANKYDFYYTGIVGIAYRRKGYGLSYTSDENTVNAMKKVFQKNIGLIADKDEREVCIKIIKKIIFNIQSRCK